MDPHHETWELWIKPEKSRVEQFEVAIGTILVQNTNWNNVDKAIANLKNQSITSYEQIINLKKDELIELIRPAGFYKQKAEYLIRLSMNMIKYISMKIVPTRKELLHIKGIGKETADSILVYCFQQASPIVGAYTRRLFSRFENNESYFQLKYEKFQDQITDVVGLDFENLGRFHALIVCHCQNVCQKKTPSCKFCFLNRDCGYEMINNS